MSHKIVGIFFSQLTKPYVNIRNTEPEVFCALKILFKLKRRLKREMVTNKKGIYPKYRYYMDIDIVIYESGQYFREIC